VTPADVIKTRLQVAAPTAALWTVSGRFSEKRDPGLSGKEPEVKFAPANIR